MTEGREPRWVKTDMQKYMNLLEKVRYLRRKGWVIYMRDNGLFMVGTREVSEAGLIAIWSREQRRESERQAVGAIRQDAEEAPGGGAGDLLPGGCGSGSIDQGDR